MCLLNRIFCYFYAFILKTPSRNDPFEASTFLLITMVVLHVVGLSLILERLLNHSFLLTFGKVGVAVAVFTTGGLFFYYYMTRKKGEALVKEFGDRVTSTKSVLAGLALTLWTFAFPFVSIAIIFLFQIE